MDFSGALRQNPQYLSDYARKLTARHAFVQNQADGAHPMIVAADRVAGLADGAGFVEIDDGVIVRVQSGAPPTTAELTVGTVLPGGVELHMHGGGGHDAAHSLEAAAAAVAYHHAHGTAATLVSLVTAPADALLRQLDHVATLAERGEQTDGWVLGAHLEGPFLSHVRCGAQNPEHLRTPDAALVREFIAAGRGQLRTMTIAPELPGAIEVIDLLVDAGIVAAVGHTDATYAQTLAAFEHGATLVTHLFNGMRPMHHREPGPILASLERGVACELINDAVHVHPALAQRILALAPVVLITDAIDAAGVGDGGYRLGGRDVVVHDGQARLVNGGGLAGSTVTLAAATGRALADGAPVDVVAAASSGRPAQLLGVADQLGCLAPGRRARLMLLDGQHRPVPPAG
jgi:N-acetylglucosamine-6-phosphate deacetylase